MLITNNDQCRQARLPQQHPQQQQRQLCPNQLRLNPLNRK